MSQILSAEHVLEFPYTRSTGPILGRFFGGLRDRRILGIRAADDRVLVPPQEYDPITSASLGPDRLVDVADEGEVTTWSWNPVPRGGQPLDRPFAWALIRLDGADTPMLHAVDVSGPDAMRTSMRVRARWAGEREGRIQDLACFEPVETSPREEATSSSADLPEAVDEVTIPIRLTYDYTPGSDPSRFLNELAEGRLEGRRCPSCEKVYLPPRGVCSMCGVPFEPAGVAIADTGTVATFAIVNVPSANIDIELPYVAAEVVFDGADTTTMFLLRDVRPDDVRMGMRVEARWRPREEWGTSMANIECVVPIDEPDADYETYMEHV